MDLVHRLETCEANCFLVYFVDGAGRCTLIFRIKGCMIRNLDDSGHNRLFGGWGGVGGMTQKLANK